MLNSKLVFVLQKQLLKKMKTGKFGCVELNKLFSFEQINFHILTLKIIIISDDEDSE